MLHAVILSLPLLAAQITPAQNAASLIERAQALYGRMQGKNVRHYNLRSDLKPFFTSEEELNTFLVRLAKDFDAAGVYTNRLEGNQVEMVEADPSYGFGQTRAVLEADWFLWFNRRIKRVDRWKYIDGQWYVNPPPLKNLDFQ